MTRIEAPYLNCSFYLYPSVDLAKAGDRTGGSGFWVGVQSEKVKDFWWVYGVSNRHVVHKNNSSVIRANSRDGATKIIDLDPIEWTEHPSGHDIAVTGIDGPAIVPSLQFSVVPITQFAKPEQINDDTIGVGDEVYMVGRFIEHDGHTRNQPSARFGNLSMMPGRPIFVDKDTVSQESFVVELRSMCGYSGSPVFVASSGVRRRQGSIMVTAGGTDRLLGVHWGHIIEHLEVEQRIVRDVKQSVLRAGQREIEVVSANTGMNGVVPAWRLLELINLPKFKEAREREEMVEVEKRKVAMPGAKLDSAAPSFVSSEANSTDANPQHREDFNSLVSAAARKQQQDD